MASIIHTNQLASFPIYLKLQFWSRWLFIANSTIFHHHMDSEMITLINLKSPLNQQYRNNSIKKPISYLLMVVCLCPVCKSETEHEYGNYKAIKINGQLVSVESSLFEDAQSLSDLYKAFVKQQGGELSQLGLRQFIYQQLIRQGSHSLSRMFARRYRTRKCIQCGHLVKRSRLP